MGEEGKANELMSALGDKMTEFQKVQTTGYGKLTALRSEYIGLQDKESGLQDEYYALEKCLVVPRV